MGSYPWAISLGMSGAGSLGRHPLGGTSLTPGGASFVNFRWSRLLMSPMTGAPGQNARLSSLFTASIENSSGSNPPRLQDPRPADEDARRFLDLSCKDEARQNISVENLAERGLLRVGVPRSSCLV